MKLSDSLQLGRTVVKPMPGQMISSDHNMGCALGMAAIAAGAQWETITFNNTPDNRKIHRTSNIETLWPWLANSVVYPCDCYEHRSSRMDMAKVVISHIFDDHVFGKYDWTLDQLISFAKEIEPKEETNDEMLSMQVHQLSE